ncbi:MAG: hypothetical protein KF891_23920 [Rhizobacter sp.]|nr:hypothetical protein [Rhizobacter sp.]
MSMPTADRERLQTLARSRTPRDWLGIQYLAALYIEFGEHPALEVTQVIEESTRRAMTGLGALAGAIGINANFAGFIANTNTEGFRHEVRDPAPWNPQTGHFFSFVGWALNGISPFELQLAVGHEFSPDYEDELYQVAAGEFRWADFGQIVLGVPLDTAGTIHYADLDAAFHRLGWDSLLVPFACGPEALADPSTRDERMRENYTGNSIQDLRCTVAGLHLGRMIGRGLFASALDVVPWLERNIMSAPRRSFARTPSDFATTPGSAAV